ncbi:MAG TPA: N-acetylneuraminate synthase family protein [Tepidisphaeraceae bacterium]|jgi:N,N'-diacetyllegionaminate synthase|nr:N-acetylneuraminate synthase family protein [Tepidisphaeraceae bacterium]
MTQITIDGRTLGNDQEPWVIAEMGVNHDGSLQRALEIVAVAAACGADAVKLQIFRANALMHVSASFAPYQKKTADAATPADMLRKYELPADDIRRIVQRIRELKMVPLATPFSPADIEIIESLRLPAIKIASPDLVNLPLLELAAATRKPLLISTGAATLEEVETTVGWLRKWDARFALLHCVSAYPTPADQANLCWVSELSEKFDCTVGYSDHTTSSLSGALAVALGASVLEKHLTYDRAARGPDHAASADERQFERYVKLAREARPFRGQSPKRVLPIENDVREVSRQSLVLRRSVYPGDLLKADDLTVQRPGTGLPAALITQAVGRKIARFASAGSMLQWDMLDAA